jgi:glycosyltransferase involved in cell wall biosynthesis
MKIFVVIPAYNEAKTIGRVISDLKKQNYKNILVVDDGSKDETSNIAKRAGAMTIRHPINQGAGAATITGFDYAIIHGAEVIVTLDADGQHDVKDVEKVLRPVLEKRADIVIGSRLINPDGMPVIRRVGNKGLNYITYLLFGVWTTDSQSGFKAMTSAAYKRMHLNSKDFEICSEIIKEIGRNNLRFTEVPIKVIYTDYSLSKGHGQSVTNGIKTFAALLKRKFLT